MVLRTHEAVTDCGAKHRLRRWIEAVWESLAPEASSDLLSVLPSRVTPPDMRLRWRPGYTAP